MTPFRSAFSYAALSGTVIFTVAVCIFQTFKHAEDREFTFYTTPLIQNKYKISKIPFIQ